MARSPNTHTQRNPYGLPFRAKSCGETHTNIHYGQSYKPMGRLRKTTACVCVFWVQREVVMTERRKEKKKAAGHLHCVLCQTTWVNGLKKPSNVHRTQAGGCGGVCVLFHIISADSSPSHYTKEETENRWRFIK